jgi:hypothetical protein
MPTWCCACAARVTDHVMIGSTVVCGQAAAAYSGMSTRCKLPCVVMLRFDFCV